MQAQAVGRIGRYCLALLLSCTSVVAAQVRISGGISGTVSDPSGGVVPGATVQLKDEGTGTPRETVTNEQGYFAFPDLSFGTYQMTVTLQGFQTAVYNKVTVESSRTTDIGVSLQPGGLSEVITVEGATPVLETSSNVISSTLNRKDITELPLPGRNAFTFARLVPGVAQPASTGSTHYNGMPGGTINPDDRRHQQLLERLQERRHELLRHRARASRRDRGSHGRIGRPRRRRRRPGRRQPEVRHPARHQPVPRQRLRAATATTPSTPTPTTTRSRGLPKPELRRHDFGGNFGGPLVPRGKWRDKLFLFVNYEQEYIPQSQTRTQTLLTAEAEQGIFRYQTAAGEQRTANVLQIAAQNGFSTTADPDARRRCSPSSQSARQLGTRRPAPTASAASSCRGLEPQKQINYYPTARLDYQITPNLSWMGSWNLYRQDAQGRPNWPFAGLADAAGHVPQLVVDHLDRPELDDQPADAQRVPLRHPAQRRHDAGRERADYALNGIVNGFPARFTLPLGLQPLSADNCARSPAATTSRRSTTR